MADIYKATVSAVGDEMRKVMEEPMPTGEPAESVWLGRQQVADEVLNVFRDVLVGCLDDIGTKLDDIDRGIDEIEGKYGIKMGVEDGKTDGAGNEVD